MTLARHAAAALLATTLVLGVWVGASHNYFPLTSVDYEDGRRLFESRCASCHAVQEGQGTSFGPSLAGIGATAADRIPGYSAEEYLVQAIVDPDAYRHAAHTGVMPEDVAAGLSQEDVKSLVGYLMLQAGMDDPSRVISTPVNLPVRTASLHTPVSVSEVEAGRELFLGKGGCNKCHLLRETPGFALRAPSLRSIGLHDRDYLRESILEPSKEIAEEYAFYSVQLTSGNQVAGRILPGGSKNAVRLLSEEDLRVMEISHNRIDVDDRGRRMIQRSPSSTMPDGINRVLSDSEIDQLVSFLKTLQP